MARQRAFCTVRRADGTSEGRIGCGGWPWASSFHAEINLEIDYSNSRDWHGLQENISSSGGLRPVAESIFEDLRSGLRGPKRTKPSVGWMFRYALERVGDAEAISTSLP